MRADPIMRFLIASACLGASVSLVPFMAAHAERSRAMLHECRAVQSNTPESRQRTEQWVQQRLQAFLPTQEQSLRMRAVEAEAEQVKLAFYGLSSTCEQYRAGTIAREDADNALHGFEQTISNFLHDLGNEALITASRGQVSDLPSIRTMLTDIGAAGRQAALHGEEDLAEEARRKMVDSLIAFSRTFVEQSCWEQVFDDELPYSIQRQNDILGTGIDVLPCAQRRFTVYAESLTFESCTIRGVGDWRVQWIGQTPLSEGGVGSGHLANERDRARGDYAVNWGANGVEYRTDGKMELARRDNGPGEKGTYTLSGDYHMRLIKGKNLIRPFEQLMGVKVKPARGPFTEEARVSDKPCRSLDE